jgi:Uma2 family endonuclease
MSTPTKAQRPAARGRAEPLDPRDAIPPLENGDHLTRAEFERRYDAMPHVKKAELIQGVVYMPSPVAVEHHGEPHFDIITWLGVYRAGTPGIRAGDNASVRLDDENMPQPDVSFFIAADHGGQSRVGSDDYLEGAPEFVAEVASTSASYDLHQKLETYRAHGVREYVVWRTRDQAIDWFVRRGDRFERLGPGPDGLLRSETFPGLWLDPEALLRGDLARVLDVVRLGMATPEHAEFVRRLAEAAARPQTEVEGGPAA